MQENEKLDPVVRRGPPTAVFAARVSVQTVAGLVLGVGTGYLGTVFGGRLVEPGPGGFGDIEAMLGGLLLGFPLGASIGIWFGGRLLGGRSPLWHTLLGAFLGVGIGLLGLRLDNNANATFGWILLIALCLLGAFAGYYGTQKRSIG